MKVGQREDRGANEWDIEGKRGKKPRREQERVVEGGRGEGRSGEERRGEQRIGEQGSRWEPRGEVRGGGEERRGRGEEGKEGKEGS